jgi:hypothetical protein
VALAQDVIDLKDALKIEKTLIGGFDWGRRSGRRYSVQSRQRLFIPDATHLN